MAFRFSLSPRRVTFSSRRRRFVSADYRPFLVVAVRSELRDKMPGARACATVRVKPGENFALGEKQLCDPGTICQRFPAERTEDFRIEFGRK